MADNEEKARGPKDARQMEPGDFAIEDLQPRPIDESDDALRGGMISSADALPTGSILDLPPAPTSPRVDF